MMKTVLLSASLVCVLPQVWLKAADAPGQLEAARAPELTAQTLGRTADGQSYILHELKVTLRDGFAQELKRATGPRRALNHALLTGLHPAIKSIKARHSNGRAFLNGEELPSHIRRRAGELTPRLGRMLTFVLHANVDAATVVDELRALPQVESASLSVVLHTMDFVPNDPGYVQQWAPAVIGMPAVWDITPRQLIRVAIVDTGVDLQHPDLQAVTVLARGGFGDFPTGNAPTDGRRKYDHGTHVAGIVAADMNGEGVVGFGNQIQLIVMNCASWNDDPDPSKSEYKIANTDDAINQAITDQARIINCSFGVDIPANLPDSLKEVLDEAYAHNVLVVCAAGNGGTDSIGDDTTGQDWDQHPTPFIVGNLQPADILAPSSNYGWGVDLVAPGTGIYSTIPTSPPPPGGSPYGTKSGTSMAAPMVSGAAAVIMSMGKGFIDDHSAKHLLARMATDLGETGKDALFGWGRLTLSAPMLSVLREADAFVSPVDNTGGQNGDYDQPWSNLPAALAAVPERATLVLNGGDVDTAVYHYPAQTIAKPCTLTAFPDRPVIIGQ